MKIKGAMPPILILNISIYIQYINGYFVIITKYLDDSQNLSGSKITNLST